MTDQRAGEPGTPTLDIRIEGGLDCAVATLRCSGVLSARTRPTMLGAVYDALGTAAQRLVIDVTGVDVVGFAGANTLVSVDRVAARAGRDLTWRGLDRGQLESGAPAGMAAA